MNDNSNYAIDNFTVVASDIYQTFDDNKGTISSKVYLDYGGSPYDFGICGKICASHDNTTCHPACGDETKSGTTTVPCKTSN